MEFDYENILGAGKGLRRYKHASQKGNLLARLSLAHPSQALLQDPSPVAVQEIDAVHAVHDGVAEEHVAVLLGLRQGHASQIQRVALRPARTRGVCLLVCLLACLLV